MKNTLVQLYGKFTAIAYEAFMFRTHDSLALSVVFMPIKNSGWEILLTSQESRDTNTDGYNATAFINIATKELVIANAGTIVSQGGQAFEDVQDDLLLSMHDTPQKISAARHFVAEVLVQCAMLGLNLKELSIVTTGHSLGAVMSDLVAIELLSRGLHVILSITFESPGSKPVIKDAIKDHEFTHDISLEHLSLIDFQVYNGPHNLINRTNSQFGDVHQPIPGTYTDVFDELVSKTEIVKIGCFGRFFKHLAFCHKKDHIVESIVKKEVNDVVNSQYHHLDKLLAFYPVEADDVGLVGKEADFV